MQITTIRNETRAITTDPVVVKRKIRDSMNNDILTNSTTYKKWGNFSKPQTIIIQPRENRLCRFT